MSALFAKHRTTSSSSSSDKLLIFFLSPTRVLPSYRNRKQHTKNVCVVLALLSSNCSYVLCFVLRVWPSDLKNSVLSVVDPLYGYEMYGRNSRHDQRAYRCSRSRVSASFMSVLLTLWDLCQDSSRTLTVAAHTARWCLCHGRCGLTVKHFGDKNFAGASKRPPLVRRLKTSPSVLVHEQHSSLGGSR